MVDERPAWMAEMGQRQRELALPLDAISGVVVAKGTTLLEAWARGFHRRLTRPYFLL